MAGVASFWTQRLISNPESDAITVDVLQDVVTRLSDEWGSTARPTTDTVTGQIGQVRQLRGHTTAAYEPAAVATLPHALWV
jgi:hypothetical protein